MNRTVLMRRRVQLAAEPSSVPPARLCADDGKLLIGTEPLLQGRQHGFQQLLRMRVDSPVGSRMATGGLARRGPS
jgi:hypothetical protein